MRVRIRTPTGAAATTGSPIRRNGRRSPMQVILTAGTDKSRRADTTLCAAHRFDRPVAGRATPVEPGAERGQHLHHVPYQIVGHFTVVEHPQPTPMSRQPPPHNLVVIRPPP